MIAVTALRRPWAALDPRERRSSEPIFYIEREIDGLTVLGMMGEAVKLTGRPRADLFVDRVIRPLVARSHSRGLVMGQSASVSVP